MGCDIGVFSPSSSGWKERRAAVRSPCRLSHSGRYIARVGEGVARSTAGLLARPLPFRLPAFPHAGKAVATLKREQKRTHSSGTAQVSHLFPLSVDAAKLRKNEEKVAVGSEIRQIRLNP